ncbi:MAG: molybdate ABC transporter substrate-binding protein [Gammaproteobacteria bacterium]
MKQLLFPIARQKTGRVILQLMWSLTLLIYFPQIVAGETKIAAATNLTFVLEEIVEKFESETGNKVKISFASSGILTRQIEKGAPFELFLSADEIYVDRLSEQNLTQGKGDVYALGHLVIFHHETDRSPNLDQGISSLDSALENKLITHFSIPNPELAPYGRIAKQALKNAGLWEKILPFLIYGESASQSAMFIKNQAVEGALLPESLAIILKQKGLGNYQLLSPELYSPLNQKMVLLNSAGAVANTFYTYLLQENTQNIFKKNGFGSIDLESDIKELEKK